VDLAVDGCIETASGLPAKTELSKSADHLKMVVWERGAGPTLACGTGACALSHRGGWQAGKIPQEAGKQVRVHCGGDLFIEWRKADNKIYMTGPATFAFNGNAKVAA
jgi:diaminopimelate epimerase